MVSNEIIYNLTIPDQVTDEKLKRDDFRVDFPVEDDKKPVIVLLGWAGAEDKYLKIYSKIYEERGLTTFRCIIPLHTMFVKKSHMPLVGEKLVELLNDHRIAHNPIIVHCFSNGGSFIYHHISQALKSSIKPLQIKGVIFDSAPCKRRISTFFQSIRPIVGGNLLLNIPVSLILCLLCIFVWIFEYIQINILRWDIVEFKPFSSLMNEENKWPQHFIYSKADMVIPHQDVECFANHRKSLGVHVTMQCYENTPHVKHYASNKLSYTQSVLNFISKCLDLAIV